MSSTGRSITQLLPQAGGLATESMIHAWAQGGLSVTSGQVDAAASTRWCWLSAQALDPAAVAPRFGSAKAWAPAGSGLPGAGAAAAPEGLTGTRRESLICSPVTGQVVNPACR